jgi:2-dehydro-3-deoxygalactonokinase
MNEPFAALVDWGTTQVRLWVVARDGSVLAESRGEEGMRHCLEHGFESAFARHLEAAGGRELPTMVCGMAGARGAWFEAPYLDTPAALADVPHAAVRVPGAASDVRILPGVAQRDSEAPNVMRGEETQLMGAVEAGESCVVCMPGTHCKWVEVSEGRLMRFSTFMTGEVFEALTRHTILAQSVGARSFAPDHPSFAGAARRGLLEPEHALARIFEARAGQLLGFEAQGDGGPHLSGLLIGSEIAAALRMCPSASVTLVASGAIATLYLSVLEKAGVSVRYIDAEATVRRGLFSAAASVWSGAE